MKIDIIYFLHMRTNLINNHDSLGMWCGEKKIGNPYESLCVFVDLMDILLAWRNNSVKNVPQTLFMSKLLIYFCSTIEK
jgi:hypothetical protein